MQLQHVFLKHAIYLCNAGGGIDILQDTDAEKNLPFHLAIENGHLELVKLCIQRAKKEGKIYCRIYCVWSLLKFTKMFLQDRSIR